MTRIIAVICCVAFLGTSPTPPVDTAGLGLHLHPCTVSQTAMPAQCGTFGVYENRAARTGRIIQLELLIVPALHPHHRAVAEIAGGPGQAVTPIAPYFLGGRLGKVAPALHADYDFIFM